MERLIPNEQERLKFIAAHLLKWIMIETLVAQTCDSSHPILLYQALTGYNALVQ